MGGKKRMRTQKVRKEREHGWNENKVKLGYVNMSHQNTTAQRDDAGDASRL